MKPIPILFTIPNFITAGSGRVMFNILTRLDPCRYTPTVCVSKKGGAIEQELEALGIQVLELPFTVPVKPYATFFPRAAAAARSLHPYGFKLWHSFHYSDDYSEPIIARLSGVRAWVYTKKSMSWGSRAWLMRSYLASRIVADNDDMPRAFFARPGLSRKVRVIHHGLPLDQFHPDVPPRLNLRGKYQIPSSSILLGCVAQLVPVKDHSTLIQAAAKLSNVHVMLAGNTTDTSYFQRLQDLARELGISERIHFCGNVSDIPAFLSEIDIFVLPTMGSGRMEGCPVALLEAMACGKPCIATNIPGSRDLIVDHESGLMVPPGDSTAIAAAVQSLIASPELCANFAGNARLRVEQHFSIKQEVQAHEALYAELLHGL